MRPIASAASVVAWCALLACVAATAALAAPPRAARAIRVPACRVDLASAPAEEIAMLPGVGPSLAARIVAARAARPLRAFEDLAHVDGLGDATLAALRAEARIGRPAGR